MVKHGIVGTGKVGTTLGMAFERAGHTVVRASSRNRELSQKVADESDIVFLTVSDDAIADVAAEIQWRAGIGVVHCSGSLDLDVLAPAAAQQARVASFHPVQMFADVHSALHSLPETTVVLDGADSLLDQLEALTRQIQATPLRLQIRNRALYHTADNYAGPFVIALLREAATLWNHVGVPEEQTLRTLIPLIRSTLTGVQAAGLAAGMGGPVARGSRRTIERHIRAFLKSAPDQLNLYCVLCERTIPLARERGTLSPEAANHIRELVTFVRHPNKSD